jgi:hypothetical protein
MSVSHRTGSALPLALVVLAVPLAAGLAGCSGSDEAPAPASAASRSPSASATSPGLDSYTDRGDACAQAISAISYADDTLLPLGQEAYQTFDDVVRSRLAAVAGTLSLEAKDWPDQAVYKQAQIVGPLAEAAGAQLTENTAAAKAARSKVLLRYRIAAGTLILVCQDAMPSPTPSAS